MNFISLPPLVGASANSLNRSPCRRRSRRHEAARSRLSAGAAADHRYRDHSKTNFFNRTASRRSLQGGPGSWVKCIYSVQRRAEPPPRQQEDYGRERTQPSGVSIYLLSLFCRGPRRGWRSRPRATHADRDSPLPETSERTILASQRLGILRIPVQGAFRRGRNYSAEASSRRVGATRCIDRSATILTNSTVNWVSTYLICMSATRTDHCNADRQIQYRRYGPSPNAMPAIPLFS